MRITLLVPAGLAIGLLACADSRMPTSAIDGHSMAVDVVATPPLFQDGFESGTLASWDDGENPSYHRVVTDASLARSGSRLLEVTYPAGDNGSWLTKFILPGYQSVHVSYWIRFPATWQGGSSLLGVYGSSLTNQWSAHGQAGVCPTGENYFTSFVVSEGGDPGPPVFSTSHLDMPRTGTQCWGDAGSASLYTGPGLLTRDRWHQVEFYVQANTPGVADGVQRLWIDGALRAEWTGLRFRSTPDLVISSIQLATYSATSVTQTQRLFIDDVVVRQGTAPNAVTSIEVTPSTTTLNVGASTQLAAIARDLDGAPVAGLAFAWTSSNPAVATVSSNGLVTAHAGGVAEVTASAAGLSGRAVVTVAGSTPVAPVVSVTLTPASTSVGVGQSVQFVATLRDAAGNILTGRNVSWYTNHTAQATVDATGRATGVSPGTAWIVAFSEGQNASAQLTVTDAPPLPPPSQAPVISVTLTPAATSVGVGESVQFVATLRDGAGNILTGRNVFWYTNHSAQATVDATGRATGVSPGTAWIVAYSEGQNASAPLTVTAASPPPPSSAPVVSVTLTPTSPSVVVGQSVQFVATLRDGAGNILTGRTITWYTNHTSVATVDANGRATGVNPGEAYIVAYSEGQNATAILTVSGSTPPPPPPPPPAPVISVTLAPSSGTVAVGQSIQFVATLRDAAGNILTGRKVTWYTNHTAHATVDATGLAIGVSPGTAAIVAYSEGQNATALLTITSSTPPPPPPLVVTRMDVTPATATVAPGATRQFAATEVLSDGTSRAATGVTWTATGGTVSPAGLYTAGSSAGSYRVIGTKGTFADTAAVTITAPPPVVQQIIVTPASVTLATATTQQFTATAQMSNGTQQPATVTWTATGGTVTAVGLYTAGTSAGSYRVIATQQGGTLADTAAITLTVPLPPPPGGALAWFEDFRTSLTGKGLYLDLDGPGAINRVTTSSTTGTWPSALTHVAQNIYAPESGDLLKASNLWPATNVGQYLFARMLLNNALPNGVNIGGDHGFQTNIGGIEWDFGIWAGNAGMFNLVFTTGDAYTNGHLEISAPKNTVLRLEWRAYRNTSSTALLSCRVYNNQTGALLGSIDNLAQSSVSATIFREFLFGMSGQYGSSYSGGSLYWGAVAFRVSSNANDWIGPYPVAGVEQ